MVKKILILVVLTLYTILCFTQTNKNLSLLSNFIFPPSRGDLSDIWGHTNGTDEYALVGLFDGVSIVDVTTPSSPNEVFYVAGAGSIWRDLKVWNNHAYITNETGGGLMIIDMSNLPGAILQTDVYSYSGNIYPFNSAHDIYIDENGVAYIMGADNGVGGAIILDLTVDPKAPVELGRYDDFYLHDGMARNDTLWGGAINNGFFTVIDVSNKAAPVTMATHTTPNSFTHNCWISDDGNTLYTTDEVSNSFIGAYDVSDLTNITELDRIQSSPGQNVIPHNTFFLNEYLITSYYRDGITIHDVSQPNSMIEVGNYDTSPAFSGDGFNGAWGVYPYLPSGNIIVSDIENGLFVLGPTYVRGARLQGDVTNALTLAPLDNVSIDILTTTISSNTNVLGQYITGVADAGTYDVIYSKFGFESDTIFNLLLSAGATVNQDVQLTSKMTFTLQGQVTEATTSNPIENATVLISSSQFSTTVNTDAAGNYSIPNFIEGVYDVFIGKWGYKGACLTNQNIDMLNNPYSYSLDEGYADDFIFDLGWTVSGNALVGGWVKDIPLGTTFGGNLSNPGVDSPSDCGDEAYVTGNSSTSAGGDDVDDGETILTSPVFDLSSSTDPVIHFDRWFYTAGGGSASNDSLIISLTNGVDTNVIDIADTNDVDNSTWASKSINVLSVMSLTNNMRLIVRTMDFSPGHIVEAGFDNFFVSDSIPSGITDVYFDNDVSVYPNPFASEINISIADQGIKNVRVVVVDVTGRKIDEQVFNNSIKINYSNNYKKGVYFINIYGDGELINTQKIVK